MEVDLIDNYSTLCKDLEDADTTLEADFTQFSVLIMLKTGFHLMKEGKGQNQRVVLQGKQTQKGKGEIQKQAKVQKTDRGSKL